MTDQEQAAVFAALEEICRASFTGFSNRRFYQAIDRAHDLVNEVRGEGVVKALKKPVCERCAEPLISGINSAYCSLDCEVAAES